MRRLICRITLKREALDLHQIQILQQLRLERKIFDVSGDGKAKNRGQREESCRREAETGVS